MGVSLPFGLSHGNRNVSQDHCGAFRYGREKGSLTNMIPSFERNRIPACAAAVLAMLASGHAAAQMDDAIYNYLKLERFEYEGNGDIHLFKWDIEGWTGSDDN